MSLILSLAILFLFPAVSLGAWRAAGSARLWSVTGVGLCLILLFAAFEASAIGGNVLATKYGYGSTAPQSILLHGLTLGLPLLATALAVQALAGRLSSRIGLYVIAVLCAGVAWVVGILGAIQILVVAS